jgi:hypothetical protein
MAAETIARKACRVGCRSSRQSPPAALALLMALGCFTQKPSSESAPGAAPEAPAPGHELRTPAPAPPSPAESLEEKREAPAPVKGAERSTPAGAAVPPASSAPLSPRKKAAAKARSGAQPEAERDRSERAVGGGGSESPSDPLRRRLDRAYRAGTPDCPSARDRKKAVCDLAAQICQLIDRDPNVASVAEYCADAKERCAEAQRRTEERCPD